MVCNTCWSACCTHSMWTWCFVYYECDVAQPRICPKELREDVLVTECVCDRLMQCMQVPSACCLANRTRCHGASPHKLPHMQMAWVQSVIKPQNHTGATCSKPKPKVSQVMFFCALQCQIQQISCPGIRLRSRSCFDECDCVLQA